MTRGRGHGPVVDPAAPPAPPEGTYEWQPLASAESGQFTLTVERQVRYGANGTYRTKTFAPGTYTCYLGAFDGIDPTPGVPKVCQVYAPLQSPVVLTAPAILGSPTVGSPIGYSAGGYSGTVASRTRQWTIDGAPISGATGTTYTPVNADETHALGIVETASNAAGSSAPNPSATKIVGPMAADPGDGVNDFGLVTRSNAFAWNGQDWSAYVTNNPWVKPSKHQRFEFNPFDRKFYFFGGDYGDYSLSPALGGAMSGGYGSGTNLMFRWAPTIAPSNAELLQQYLPADPEQLLFGHGDEHYFGWDTRNNVGYALPQIRWHWIEGPNVIMGRGMEYDPARPVKTRWRVKGAPDYATAPPVLHKNDGLGYPTYALGETINYPAYYYGEDQPTVYDSNGTPFSPNAKWGRYDWAQKKHILAQPGTALYAVNAGTYTVETPVGPDYANGPAPYDKWDYNWYHGAGWYDCYRRDFLSLKAAIINYPAGGDLRPDYGYITKGNIDSRQFSVRATANRPYEVSSDLKTHKSYSVDFSAFLHDPRLDMLIMVPSREEGVFPHPEAPGWLKYDYAPPDGPTAPEGNRMFALPGDPSIGNSWEEWLCSDTQIESRWGQQMHWSPPHNRFFLIGGINDNAGASPVPSKLYWPDIVPRKVAHWPQWRRDIAADTIGTIAAVKTMAALDIDGPAINPNHPGLPPWWGHSGGSQQAVLNAWNGAGYDHTRRELSIYCASGHGDRGENGWYRIVLQEEDPGWTLPRKPTGWVGNPGLLNDGQEASGVYFDGSPRARHTYNSAVCVPKLGPLVVKIAAPYDNSGPSTQKVWRLNRDTNEYEYLWDFSNPSEGLSPYSAAQLAVAYDRTRYCLWMLNTGDSQRLHCLNLLTGEVTHHGSFDTHTSGNNYMAYLPEVDALFCAGGGGQLFLWRLKDHQKFDLNPLMNGSWHPGFGATDYDGSYSRIVNQDQLANGTSIVGIDWDEWRHRICMWGGDTNRNKMATLTPTGDYFTDPWVRGSEAFTGAMPSLPCMTGTHGRWRVCPALDGAILFNHVAEPVYFWAFS